MALNKPVRSPTSSSPAARAVPTSPTSFNMNWVDFSLSMRRSSTVESPPKRGEFRS
jgi:hypothetical protein